MEHPTARKLIHFLFSSIAVLFVVSCIVGFGYGGWIFQDETEETAETETSVDYNADNIRENAAFGDGADFVNTGTKYYDVYFMSQMCDIDKHILSASGTITIKNPDTDDTKNPTIEVNNYTFKSAPVPYSSETYPNKDYQDFGAWTDKLDGTGTALTTDTTEDENIYFKKFSSVAQLTSDQYSEIGTPYFYLDDHKGYHLSFLCWTLNDNRPVYGTVDDYFPDIGSKIASTTETDKTPRYQVTGYYPYASDFASFYSNTLFRYYAELNSGANLYYVNGRPSLFFFPVYTTGKNYVSSNDDGSRVTDAIRLDEHTGTSDGGDTTSFYDSTNTRINSTYFSYEGQTSSTINTAFGNDYDGTYFVYKLSNFTFNESYYTIFTDPDSSGGGWQGTWYKITTVSYGRYTNGMYNVYVIAKNDTSTSSANTISSSDITTINTALEGLGIKKYYTRGASEDFSEYGSGFGLSSNESRDYYIVCERVYEPKLVGGPTGGISYADSDYNFIRQGIDSSTIHNHVLFNVELDGTKQCTYTYTYYASEDDDVGKKVTVYFPSYYFGILIAGNPDQEAKEGFSYTTKIAADNPTTDNPPKIDTNTTTGGTTSYYKSDDLFMYYDDDANKEEYEEATESTYVEVEGVDGVLSLKDAETYGLRNNFKLIRVKDPGTYSLLFTSTYKTVTYSEGEGDNAREVKLDLPESVTFWGYKLSVYFINICDTTATNTLRYKTRTDTNKYVDTDTFTYCKTDYDAETDTTTGTSYSYGDTLSASDQFYKKQDDGTLASTPTTLGTILSDLGDDKEMVDLVSGQKITTALLESESFIIKKHHVFVIKKVGEAITYANAT